MLKVAIPRRALLKALPAWLVLLAEGRTRSKYKARRAVRLHAVPAARNPAVNWVPSPIVAVESPSAMVLTRPVTRTSAGSSIAVTVTASDSLRVFALGGVLLPLSTTVQVTYPVPLPSGTVLYFSPCSSVAVRRLPAVTGVVPSALKSSR